MRESRRYLKTARGVEGELGGEAEASPGPRGRLDSREARCEPGRVVGAPGSPQTRWCMTAGPSSLTPRDPEGCPRPSHLERGDRAGGGAAPGPGPGVRGAPAPHRHPGAVNRPGVAPASFSCHGVSRPWAAPRAPRSPHPAGSPSERPAARCCRVRTPSEGNCREPRARAPFFRQLPHT